MKDTLLIVAVFLFLVFGYIDNFIATNAPRHHRHQKPLYDYGFAFFDKKLPDIMPNILLLILIIYFLFRCRNNKILITSFIVIITFMYIIRSIIFLSTEVPLTTIDRHCDYSTKWDFRHIKWLSFTNQDSCRVDYMFSGHTIYATIIMIYFIF